MELQLRFPPAITFVFWDVLRFRINSSIGKEEILRCFESDLTDYYPEIDTFPFEYRYFLISFDRISRKFIVVRFEYFTDKIAILDAYRPDKREIEDYFGF